MKTFQKIRRPGTWWPHLLWPSCCRGHRTCARGALGPSSGEAALQANCTAEHATVITTTGGALEALDGGGAHKPADNCARAWCVVEAAE